MAPDVLHGGRVTLGQRWGEGWRPGRFAVIPDAPGRQTSTGDSESSLRQTCPCSSTAIPQTLAFARSTFDLAVSLSIRRGACLNGVSTG